MKKLAILSAVVAVGFASCVGVMVAKRDTSPLKGKLKTAFVTKSFYVTNLMEHHDLANPEQPTFRHEQSYDRVLSLTEQSLTITNAQKLRELAKSMEVVQEAVVGGSHSMEDYPRYKMTVTYEDGATNGFSFTRTEWSFSADTPPELIKFLDENGP